MLGPGQGFLAVGEVLVGAPEQHADEHDDGDAQHEPGPAHVLRHAAPQVFHADDGADDGGGHLQDDDGHAQGRFGVGVAFFIVAVFQPPVFPAHDVFEMILAEAAQQRFVGVGLVDLVFDDHQIVAQDHDLAHVGHGEGGHSGQQHRVEHEKDDVHEGLQIGGRVRVVADPEIEQYAVEHEYLHVGRLEAGHLLEDPAVHVFVFGDQDGAQTVRGRMYGVCFFGEEDGARHVRWRLRHNSLDSSFCRFFRGTFYFTIIASVPQEPCGVWSPDRFNGGFLARRGLTRYKL